MRINPGAYNVGKPENRKTSEKDKAFKNPASIKVKENTDKISISSEGALKSDTEMLTRSIAASIDRPTESDKLNSIRAAVENGTYYVPTDDLVNSLYSRWMGI